jgi:hypothetical protein
MKLPNGAKATIPEGKLEDYCSNPFHPDGKHKAKVFKKALGITQENSMKLRNLVLESAISGKVTKEQENNFGKIYRVENKVEGINREEILCSLWIIHKGEDIPYLTSCFVKSRKVKI